MCSSPKSSSRRAKPRKRPETQHMSAEEYSKMVNHASLCYERAVERRAAKRALLIQQTVALENTSPAQKNPAEKNNFLQTIIKDVNSFLRSSQLKSA